MKGKRIIEMEKQNVEEKSTVELWKEWAKGKRTIQIDEKENVEVKSTEGLWRYCLGFKGTLECTDILLTPGNWAKWTFYMKKMKI